ncbi:phage shock protein A (PspA) family protein [Stanieria cyanosphaera PCC 7437]|uniref:Phage shock protein A (PspA) family protein n=1 Tax=Stanieria cyanosphaera (strain ATCC 29371 / PCC 7437) TaxID=111780 RepID=K9XW41_STAC7|nr:lecithin retinol acyltransferase family protein [Stanieria cyanosphaera]AFZ35887.1 phage shock protein A (PspA) family protein [Stanieria cyanosphaera PCC 7437]
MARGDQIYVYRNFYNFDGIYQHHGIDCGDNTVIHYRKPSEIIERTSLNVFTRGNPIYIKQYVEGFSFIVDVVVERAESRLGEQKYNLLFNNCEHFATWCKTGISDSKQIRDFIPVIGRLNTDQFYEPIKEALSGKDPNNSEQLLDQALGNLKNAWERIQPEYKQVRQEIDTWTKVAQAAVQKNRDDLAKAALMKKWNYQKRANELEKQLNEVAKLTENLMLNRQNLA